MKNETRGRRSSMAAVGSQRTQSVRLWFTERRKKRKGHISSISIAQLLDSKAAIRAKVTPLAERWMDDADLDGRDRLLTKQELERRRSVYASYEASNPLSHQSSSISQTERKRLPTGAIQVTRRPTCNKFLHPSQPYSFQPYRVPQSRAPIPPRRSSSLPKESRIIEAIATPAAPLTALSISSRDGYYFEYLLTGSLNKLEFFSMPRLWPMVLDKFHNELSVRHIMLATAMIHRSRSDTNLLRLEEAQRLASMHYSNAIRLLNNSLIMLKDPLAAETREVILLTTFLLAVFELLRKNVERASWWMKSGTNLLKAAKCQSNSNPLEPRSDRNTMQLALGYELMSVSLKVKKFRTQKKRERRLGKSGFSVIMRKERTRKSVIGSWPTQE